MANIDFALISPQNLLDLLTIAASEAAAFDFVAALSMGSRIERLPEPETL
jgi:hypothetical protein